MTEYIERGIESKTLGELIAKNYADFNIIYGDAPMHMDVTHGVEIETADNTEYGRGVTVTIYPYVRYTDGMYKPYHYDSACYIALSK